VRAHLAEALGTFTLVFFGCGAIAVDAQTGQLGHTGIALAFGLVIAVMIYALGHDLEGSAPVAPLVHPLR
jgi:aquaporin Z